MDAFVVESKKKRQVDEEKSGELRAIRLRPSTTDYSTYVRRTARMLHAKGPVARKKKPSSRLLQLAKPGS